MAVLVAGVLGDVGEHVSGRSVSRRRQLVSRRHLLTPARRSFTRHPFLHLQRKEKEVNETSEVNS